MLVFQTKVNGIAQHGLASFIRASVGLLASENGQVAHRFRKDMYVTHVGPFMF